MQFKDQVREFFDAVAEDWSRGPAYIRELFAKDCVASNPFSMFLGNDSVADLHNELGNNLSDIQFKIQSLSSSGNFVIHQWELAGHLTGSFFGVEGKGKKTVLNGCSVYQFLKGKIILHMNAIDFLAAFKKMGCCIGKEYFINQAASNYRIDVLLEEIMKWGNLTKREAITLALWANTQTTAEIITLLGGDISQRVIEEDIERTQAKLKCASKAELLERGGEHVLRYIYELLHEQYLDGLKKRSSKVHLIQEWE